MRFAILLTGAALAVAAPALSQTTQTTTPATDPAQTTTPDPTASPAGVSSTSPTTGAPTAASGAVPASPAATAPDPAAAVVTPAVGVTVLDPTGVPVGKIKGMDSQYVTLTTDKGEVRLPVAGVGPGRGGAAVGLTKAQIDAAVVKAEAAKPAAGKVTTKTTTKKR